MHCNPCKASSQVLINVKLDISEICVFRMQRDEGSSSIMTHRVGEIGCVFITVHWPARVTELMVSDKVNLSLKRLLIKFLRMIFYSSTDSRKTSLENDRLHILVGVDR